MHCEGKGRGEQRREKAAQVEKTTTTKPLVTIFARLLNQIHYDLSGISFLNNSLYNTTKLTIGNISTKTCTHPHTNPTPNKMHQSFKKISLMGRGKGMVEQT